MTETVGKVITNYGANVKVQLDDDSYISCLIRDSIKGELAVGDYVNISFPDNSEAVIEKIKKRKNIICRANPYKKKNKNIAANIDQALIVIAHIPEPIELYIDRYLVALHTNNIEPVIVLNKIDAHSYDDTKKLDKLLLIYKKLGYKTAKISAKANRNIDYLLELLQNKSSIFIGQSGVGKSEILNSILGKDTAGIGEVSTSTGRGKHTTTCSTLYTIAEDTFVIDSPGIREFGLSNIINKDQLFDGFLDFKQNKGLCRFRNCPHEPKSLSCKIVQEVKNGNISVSRYKNYHRILKEIDEASSY